MLHTRIREQLLGNLAHLDQLLAVWEWRSGPTPWLVMKAHKGQSA